jgi:hypothetical protein
MHALDDHIIDIKRDLVRTRMLSTKVASHQVLRKI